MSIRARSASAAGPGSTRSGTTVRPGPFHISAYSSIDNFKSRDISQPINPIGRDVLIKVEACSVNPIDTKIRSGIYDDAPGCQSTRGVPSSMALIGLIAVKL
ncbi:hypothetical protein B0J13DRAFT_533398 [Dactylonectria estremocensis]|uniref:Uncharacterized protein n=1 Tax=Dactylonectria estremocensis TaxID=1079267 RepID=A0A9P9DA62_9HYPO|nr:hypothetical protein B0J13DRAFT_533398 [Dactylonectria estremocensis]